jgi:TonB family protein
MGLVMIRRWTSILGAWPLLATVFCSQCWAQSDAINSWKQKIFNELKSHAQFPPEACGQTGEPKLAFTLDRSGKVIFSKLLTGSGVAAIDTAAAAAVNNAQPFPPAPADVLDNDLKFVIVLVFAKPEGVSTEEFSRSCEGLRDEIKLRSRLRGVCRGC